MKIVFDTNFWIDIFRFKIDIVEVFDLIPDGQIVMIKPVENELKQIASKKTEESKSAKIALEFLKTNKIQVLPIVGGNVDKILLELSDESTIIATNDSLLRKEIIKRGGKTIYIRGKKHIALS